MAELAPISPGASGLAALGVVAKARPLIVAAARQNAIFVVQNLITIRFLRY
jgi:hypothetical protein